MWQTQLFAGQFRRGCRRAPQKKHCCVFVPRHSGWLTNVCWSELVGLTAREWLAEIATDDEVYNCAFLCASSSERALSNAAWSSVTLSSKKSLPDVRRTNPGDKRIPYWCIPTLNRRDYREVTIGAELFKQLKKFKWFTNFLTACT